MSARHPCEPLHPNNCAPWDDPSLSICTDSRQISAEAILASQYDRAGEVGPHKPRCRPCRRYASCSPPTDTLRNAEAEATLNAVDTKAAVTEADPQSANMAKVVGADRNIIAALSHVFIAVAIELGSGVGFWLAFEHGTPNRRGEDDVPSTALVAIDPIRPPKLLAAEVETSSEIKVWPPTLA